MQLYIGSDVMTAVVVEFKGKHNRRKIKTETKEQVAVISVGERVGAIRFRNAVASFSRDIIFADGVKHRGVCGFDDTDYRNELIFNLFLQYCLNASSEICVGICDIKGLYYPRLIPVIAAVSTVVIHTECNLDEFCRLALTQTGACPFVSDTTNELLDCDAVFSIDGLMGFCGDLFGKGGITRPKHKICFPFSVDDLLEKGVDEISLAALLSHDYRSLRPQNVAAQDGKNCYPDFLKYYLL